MYIENYRNFILNQEFNFSGKYRFSFKDGILYSQVYNENYPDNFFKTKDNIYSKINNITAIIGQNGCGKTTLLHFIKENFSYIDCELVHDNKGNIVYFHPKFRNRFIIIIKQENDFILYNLGDFRIDKITGDVEIKVGSLTIDTEQNKKNRDKGLDKIECIVPELLSTKILYFSNAFDFNKIDYSEFYYDIDNIYLDISSNILFFNDYNQYRDNSQHNEILRQIRFLLSPIANKFISQKPKFLKINCKGITSVIHDYLEYGNDMDIINILDKHSNINVFAHLIIFTSILDFADVYKKIKKEENNIKNEISNLLNNIYSYYRSLDEVKFCEKSLTAIKNKIEEMLRTNNMDKQLKIKDVKYYEKTFKSRIRLYKALYENDNFKRSNKDLYSSIDFYVSISEVELISDVLIYTNQSNFLKRVFTFDLSGISSGERAMLLTYSRFYWVVDRHLNEKYYRTFGFTDSGFHEDYYKLGENLIILMDEGELFLHPNWQREYLNNIINYFNELFKDYDDVKNIQIILTSNSPFVISDLPKENIILLENRNGLCHVKNNNKLLMETFGANIHMLLSDSFFMSNGLIGEFAKNKINDVINFIRNDFKNERNYGIEFIIKSIGEPIIKTKLQEMYESKLNYDVRLRRIDDEIERLQNERKQILEGREESND